MSCRGEVGYDVGVGWCGSCRGGVDHIAVGWVMLGVGVGSCKGWGMSCRGVGCVMWGCHVGVGWVM